MKKPICLFLAFWLLFSGYCLPVLAAEYTLAPSDQLEVRIIGQKDLDTKQSIAPDGTISLPFLGRVTAQGQTLAGFNNYLSVEFAKYIKSPQVVVYLTPRPIYVIQHDYKKNVWDVKEANSVDEARALAGMNYTGRISNGDIVSVEVGQKPDFWEDNWYKVLTGTAVAVGIYATMHR
ncbi:MAG: polysaccharide biosynthesis/export family protein [Candidatus Margulisiibacteriota bacterium]